jgi:hypothetical protein
MSDSPTFAEFDLPRGGYGVICALGSANEFLRVENHDDRVGVTWSTRWTVLDLLRLFDPTSRQRRGARLRPRPVVRSTSSFTAIVIRASGSPIHISECVDVAVELEHNPATVRFVRFDSSGFSVTWADRSPINGWNRQTLGLLQPAIRTRELDALFKMSGTECVSDGASGLAAWAATINGAPNSRPASHS